MKKYIHVLFLLLVKTASANVKTNLALRGEATHIDSYNELGGASNAIDGNRNSIYYSKSCTHTFTTTDPWWRVDLRDTYVITSITIVNRGDCCAERLDGAEIRVGNSLVNNGNDNPIVATISHIRSLETFTMSEPVEGRYVNVFLPGTDKYLTLCEVEVYGLKVNENVALRGEASQIDTYDDLGAASNAIDGKKNSIYESKSCTRTLTTTNPWWRVDLRGIYIIKSIIITNRGDCCAENLDGAEIRVGNSLLNNGNDNRLIAKVLHIPAGRSIPLYLPQNVKGRYVTVFLPGTDKHLSLCEVEIYGYKEEPVNVALRGKASQIDTYNHLAAASNAIDGNRDSIYYSNSCTHTFTTTDPWWRVDLLVTYVITSITITNRGDCCAERLDGAEIRAGNSLENNGNNNPVVATISHIRRGGSETFTLPDVKARYVNVFLPGRDKYLTLCEVEVYGYQEELVNVAVRGEAAQIDDNHDLGSAANAIDGNLNSNYSHNSCSHTPKLTNPWWRVDLLQPHVVTSITITNRGDCCGERLDGAEIRVGSSLQNEGNDNPVVAKYSHTPENPHKTFTFTKHVEGRYVNVFLPGTNRHLTLCEVEVYGYPAQVNVALGGEATQIDTYNELGAASNAIDGNRDSFYSNSSCSSTSRLANPWWRVDLRHTYVVTSVSVTNRMDCCHEEIDGAEIRVGNSLENDGNDNPRMATIPRIPKGISQRFPFLEPVKARYVNVFLPGTDKKLTFCEVEVYGYSEEGVPIPPEPENERP